jgi:hypothetical protein
VWWSQVLTTVGAVLEIAGLTFTGVALWDRGERHGAPPGRVRRAYRRIDSRIRARLGRPRTQTLEVQPAGVVVTAGQVRLRARPGELADDASVEDKVAWLVRYVEHLDRESQSMIEEHDKLGADLRSELKTATTTIEQRLTHQDVRFTEEMVADLGSAWVGLILATVGVSLGLIGYWLG